MRTPSRTDRKQIEGEAGAFGEPHESVASAEGVGAPEAPSTGSNGSNSPARGGDAGSAQRFGSRGGKSLAAGYGAMVVLLGVALYGLFSFGKHLTAPKLPPAAAGAGASASAEAIIPKMIIAVVVILITCRVVGGLLRRVHQPQVIGEIIAGILLGPSLLGAVWPSASHWLFPTELMPYLDLLAQFGLIFYMFLVGLELDFDLIKGRGHAAVIVSHASIVAPFVMGVTLSLWLYPTLGSGAKFTAFALFIGAAMSITAFPVLARILTDRGLYKTRIGTVALTVGAVDDVTAWCLLAVVITVARAAGLLSALTTIGLALLFIAFMILGVRPLMRRVALFYERRGRMTGTFLAAIFIGLLLSALVTNELKIHVIFGAFLFGAIMPHHPQFTREITSKVEDFSVVFLLPLFFAFSGLRTDLFSIGHSLKLWGLTLAILLVAVVGKWGGSKLAAHLAGLDWREAGALGVLVNCRGLTELIILNIGLQMGVLPPPAFAMLVLMAVLTTLMTEPALTLYYPRAVQRKMIREERPEDDGGDEVLEGDEGPRKILVAIGNPGIGRELTEMATLLAVDPDEIGDRPPAEITLLRVVDTARQASHSGAVREWLLSQATTRLKPLCQIISDAGFECHPIALAGTDTGETIARVANELDVDLVLMGYHEPLFGRRVFGGRVGKVLRQVKGDVAILVDPRRHEDFTLPRAARIMAPFGGRFHEHVGVDLAMRLARNTGAELTLLAPADRELEAERKATEAPETPAHETIKVQRVYSEGPAEEILRRSSEFDLLVLGLSDRWMTEQELLADVREEVMRRAGKPYMLVRRSGGTRGHLHRWRVKMQAAPGHLVDVYRDTADSVTANRAKEETQERLHDAEESERERIRTRT